MTKNPAQNTLADLRKGSESHLSKGSKSARQIIKIERKAPKRVSSIKQVYMTKKSQTRRGVL